MKTYVVGGAVRDRLLGLPVSDRDHVVVGATVDEMLAAGFKPVGRDFPVFLHPTTHEEYALARTERKVAPGYSGFVFHADPTVTLEADLERRDLTVNAIAEDEASGMLVDPFGGRRDLEARVFRHVGPAFAEDPVRLLRVARFCARFTDFVVAPETLALMRRMTADGEVDALVPERVWQEVARGLMEAAPVRMIELLEASGAFARLFPELERAWTSMPAGPGHRAGVLRALADAAHAGSALDVRFALFVQPAAAVGRLETLCARLAVPRSARELALLVGRESTPMQAAVASSDAAALATVLGRCDAFRRRPRFAEILETIGWTIDDEVARGIFTLKVRNAVDLAATVDAGAIARAAGDDPRAIAKRLRTARTEAIARAISQ